MKQNEQATVLCPTRSIMFPILYNSASSQCLEESSRELGCVLPKECCSGMYESEGDTMSHILLSRGQSLEEENERRLSSCGFRST